VSHSVHRPLAAVRLWPDEPGPGVVNVMIYFCAQTPARSTLLCARASSLSCSISTVDRGLVHVYMYVCTYVAELAGRAPTGMLGTRYMYVSSSLWRSSE
jgi:hypothetical protein